MAASDSKSPKASSRYLKKIRLANCSKQAKSLKRDGMTMSRTAWLTLCASGVFTTGIVYYVHTSQAKDRERLREGVIIDMARQEQKKRQNIRQLAIQSDLTKILRDQQKKYDEDDRREREKVSASTS